MKTFNVTANFSVQLKAKDEDDAINVFDEYFHSKFVEIRKKNKVIKSINLEDMDVTEAD